MRQINLLNDVLQGASPSSAGESPGANLLWQAADRAEENPLDAAERKDEMATRHYANVLPRNPF